MAILTRGLKLSELSSMTDSQRSQSLSNLFQSAFRPTPKQLKSQIDEVMCEIHNYESRYRMTSAEMKWKLANSELQESADICSWLMLVNIQNGYESQC